MLKNLLQAVSDMLVLQAPDKQTSLEVRIRVSCAKTFLDGIIKDLEKEALTPKIPQKSDEAIPEKPAAPAPKPKPAIPEGKVRIVVDSSKRITAIEGLPLDAKVMLDNKIMTHKDAIGKTFQTGKVL